MSPLSVLISLYAKESADNFLCAISSIYKDQTLKPSQIVLVKDGPLTSELEDVIRSLSVDIGEVLTIVGLKKNVGLGAALNEGLRYCKYDLVARMDTDDIATPERFRWQIDFMQSNPTVAVSSGIIEEWNSDFSKKLSCRTLPLNHHELLKFAKSRSPISHPACIFRKSLILKVGGYPDIYPEDHLLWVRVLQQGHNIANIPQVLLLMRTGEDFITRRGYKFLKGELKSYRIMYESKFLSFGELIKVSALRICVRLSPDFLKIWLYKNIR